MSKKRILIVDDEVGAARLLKASLEETNQYDVQVVNWAEDALAAARQFKPDLVLLDIIMPRLSGGNVAAQFEADSELKGTPIVFLTAAVRRHGPRSVAEHEGIICDHPCLPKPASVQQIIQCLEAHLPGVGAAPSSPAPIAAPSPAQWSAGEESQP